MIGNLVLSLLASSFCFSVCALGQKKANEITPNEIPNLIVATNTSLFMDYKVHNINVNFGFATESINNGSNPIGISGLWSFGVNESNDIKNPYNEDVSTGVHDSYLCATSYNVFRNGIPATGYTYKIIFEFATYGGSFKYNDQIFNIDGMEFYPSIVADGVAVSDFTYTLNNSSHTYSSNDIVGQYASRVVNQDNDVNTYYSLNVSYKPTSSVTNFYFQLFGNWCCNYGDDSSNALAYATGYQDGYANGLNDGKIASSGSFHGLFSAIADTPLRFLYGIFNFDLFGISMLVIVLSLLTGLIVFGIVKKFWK